jgi:hypothetical protein
MMVYQSSGIALNVLDARIEIFKKGNTSLDWKDY